MTGTMEFRYNPHDWSDVQATFWHGKTALQVRDEQHPGMSVIKKTTHLKRSIRAGVDYCALYWVQDPNAIGLGEPLLATLVEVP